MTKHMEMEHTFTWMVQNILGHGLKINNMVMVWRLGLIQLAMKEIMNKERNMELVLSNGLIPLCLLVSFISITFMGKESICGAMVVNTRVSGKITRCMAKVLLFGVMVVFTMVSISMIKRMVMVSSCGLMVGVTKATG